MGTEGWLVYESDKNATVCPNKFTHSGTSLSRYAPTMRRDGISLSKEILLIRSRVAESPHYGKMNDMGTVKSQ